MKSVASIFFALMLIIVVFYSMQVIGEQSLTNSNLDSDSIALINNFSNNLDNEFNVNNDFDEFSSNLSVNGTFDNQDVFAQEYLEGKSDGTQKTGIIKKAIKIPDMVILSLGVPEQDVSWIRNIILLIITVVLGFALYRAIFGGGKVSDS